LATHHLDLALDERAHVRRSFGRVNEEPDILFGRQPDHNPQPMLLSDVEDVAGRRRVRDPNGVDSEPGHHLEVLVELVYPLIFFLFSVRPERTIADPFYK